MLAVDMAQVTANQISNAFSQEIEFLWSAIFWLLFVFDLLAIALLVVVSAPWAAIVLVAVLGAGACLWEAVSYLRIALKM